jgi:hypothetical protein
MGSCNPFLSKRLGKHVSAATDSNATTEERCFLCGPYRDVISRTVWSNELVGREELSAVQLRVPVWRVNQRATAWPRKLKNLHCVKSVARKRLMETVNTSIHQSKPRLQSHNPQNYKTLRLKYRKLGLSFELQERNSIVSLMQDCMIYEFWISRGYDMEITVSRDVTLDIYRHFDRMCCFHLQGRRVGKSLGAAPGSQPNAMESSTCLLLMLWHR